MGRDHARPWRTIPSRAGGCVARAQRVARIAAFVWYTNSRKAQSPTIQAEARRFSQENWKMFLPVANIGWGRLLLRVAKARPNSPCLPLR